MADAFSAPDSPINLQGYLLMADPSLRDGIFYRSVILLAEHYKDEGSLGLILNRPTGKTVEELLKGKEFEPLRQVAVHDGGPVAQDQLTFSSFWWSKTRGLRYAIRISAEKAAEHTRKPGRIVRAFLGYSDWSPGQLENELRHSSWITALPQANLLGFEHDRKLWAELLRPISPLCRVLAEAPDDPTLN